MKSRLIRALQRGGVTAELRPDLWGVWRASDRRGRVIGTLSGADIDILRLQQNLKPLGNELPTVLIWSGAIEVEPNAQPIDVNSLSDVDPLNATLLEVILRKTMSPTIRDALRRACEWFRHDIEQAGQSGSHVTMNWDRLGAEASSSSLRHHTPIRSQNRAAARRRLAQLADRFSEADFAILEQTVMRELSRTQLAKAHNLRPSVVERRASGILQALVDFYVAGKPVS